MSKTCIGYTQNTYLWVSGMIYELTLMGALSFLPRELAHVYYNNSTTAVRDSTKYSLLCLAKCQLEFSQKNYPLTSADDLTWVGLVQYFRFIRKLRNRLQFSSRTPRSVRSNITTTFLLCSCVVHY